MKRIMTVLTFLLVAAALALTGCTAAAYTPEETLAVIVTLGQGAAAQRGDAETAAYLRSAAGTEREAELRAKQDAILTRLGKKLISVDDRYTALIDGFSATVTQSGYNKLVNEGFSVSVNGRYTAPRALEADAETTADNIFDTSGYTKPGAGTLIGIIDSGFLLTHNAFSDATFPAETADLKYTSYISGAAIYYKSKKIVYQRDFGDRDADASNSSGEEHGTHVAGIAAGNPYAGHTGAAPYAQLALMKVENSSGYMYDSAILAALDAAVTIGCDVVNISLGSTAGSAAYDGYDTALANAREAGTLVCVAAGNEATASEMSTAGYATAENPDNATVDNPASLLDSFAVADFQADGTPHYSTSWGPAPDLKLKPDIAGIGADVTSSVLGGNSAYGALTGTSMASPNVAGLAAAWIGSRYAGLVSEKADTVRTFLMNTASVARDASGLPYSPRVQGAGVASPAAAAAGTLTARRAGAAKLEWKDDPQKTGVYTANNIVLTEHSGASVTVTPSAEVVTEKIIDGVMTGRTVRLHPQISFTQGSAAVGSFTFSGTTTVGVEIRLSAADKALLDTYENGMYVEGYIAFAYGGRQIHLPFLAYYGDWDAPSAFDETPYAGGPLLAETADYDRYGNMVDFTYAAPFAAKTKFKTKTVSAIPGMYDTATFPAKTPDARMAADADRAAVKTGAVFSDFAIGMMRNAARIDVGVYSSEGLVKNLGYSDYTYKTYPAYDARADRYLNNLYYPDLSLTVSNTFTASEKYSLRFTAAHDTERGGTSAYVIPFTVDNTAPYAVQATHTAQGSKDILNFTVADDNYVQAAKLYYKNAAGSYVMTDSYYTPVFAAAKGGAATVSIDATNILTKSTTLYLFLVDYAYNYTYIEITDANSDPTFEGENNSTDPVPQPEGAVTVTFDTCGGDALAPLVYDPSSSAAPVLPTPARTGYEFVKWSTSIAFTDSVLVAPAVSRTLYAKWSPVVYTITYAGAETDNPATYTIEDEIELQPAVKEGCVFDGWYLEGEKIETISGMTGNLTLTAKFSRASATCGCTGGFSFFAVGLSLGVLLLAFKRY